MHEVIYDSRWIGQHGIGRFASEVRSRIHAPIVEISDGDPVSPRGLVTLEREMLRYSKGLKNRQFFSPGYAPPIFWQGKIVFTIHDLIHIDVPEEGSRFKSLYYERIVRPAMTRAQKVLTVSEYSRQRLLEWSGVDSNQIVVVGNGVDSAFSASGEIYNPGYPYILYVRNTKPHKNVIGLLKAIALMKHRDVKLILSGTADSETQHEALRLGILDRVIFAGRIPEKELPAFYRGAVLVTMPSLYEGFGLPALEGMASGIPVVVSNTTSLPEVVGNAGILVDPSDPVSIAEGLDQGLSDTQLRQKLREAGLARAQHFNWDDVALRVNQALERI